MGFGCRHAAWLAGGLGAFPQQIVDALSVDDPPTKNLHAFEFSRPKQPVNRWAREIGDVRCFVYLVSAPIWFLTRLAHSNRFLKRPR